MVKLEKETIYEISKKLDERVGAMEKRVDALEVAVEELNARSVTGMKSFEADKTVVMYRLNGKGDDMKEVENLLGFLGVMDRVQIVIIKRMPQKDGDSRALLLKVELESVAN